MNKKSIFRLLKWGALMLVVLVAFCYLWFSRSARNLVTDDLTKFNLPRTGLLLGTSRLLNNGDTNLFFSMDVVWAEDIFQGVWGEELLGVLMEGEVTAKMQGRRGFYCHRIKRIVRIGKDWRSFALNQ